MIKAQIIVFSLTTTGPPTQVRPARPPVLPGFPAGKTWSYLNFQKKAEVFLEKHSVTPFFFVPLKELNCHWT